MEKYKLLKDLPNAKAGEIFELTNTGLGHSYGDGTINWFCLFSECELRKFDILNPDKGWFEKIVEKKYGGRVPEYGDAYWFIASGGSIIDEIWTDEPADRNVFEAGSAFWTKEEAEKEAKRRKAYVILKEDAKGFVPDWNNAKQQKCCAEYNYYDNRIDVFITWNCKIDGWGLYFATEEDVKASIEAHEKEWKTWLGVEDE